MRFPFPLFFLPWFFGFAVLVPAGRAAFNPAVVAGDAQWAVYLDLNEFRNTVLGKELMAQLKKQMPTPRAGGAPANPMPDISVNFDKLLNTIGQITVYGSNFVPDPNKLDGALILSGSPELRKIAEAIVLQLSSKDAQEEPGMPFDTYRLGGEVLIGFPPEDVILISKAKAQLTKAHNVMRGTAASLAKTPNSPLTNLVKQPGTPYLIAASVAPADLKAMPDGPQARIVQLTDAGAVSLGETQGKTAVHLMLVAPSDASATKLQKIIEGMAAMLSLAESTDRQLQEFITSTRVARVDRAVTLDLAYSSERLIQMFNTISAGGRQAANRAVAVANTPPPPAPPKIVDSWKLEGAPADATPSEALLITRKIENVRLQTSSVVAVNAIRQGGTGGGEVARIDSVEITPAGGGSPLRFEAEGMRLSRYGTRNAPYASGRKVIALTGSTGNATFEFPGAEGDYTVSVRYVNEAEAKTTLNVSVRDPAPAPLPAVEIPETK